jgi:hypothetical protein
MSDDFSEVVKRALASRVGNRCSNPQCKALTSGPQTDPAKAVNLGVAAHITAASPGGPRYDPNLLPEERSGAPNGIWLCQNCAKLIDNDSARFTVDQLNGWKIAAEQEARERVGKTDALGIAPQHGLRVNDRVILMPTLPRRLERSEWIVQASSGDCLFLQKVSSMERIEVPASLIEGVHRFGSNQPAQIQLRGRLQWISVGQHWQLFPSNQFDGLQGEHGFARDVNTDYPSQQGLTGEFYWCREDLLTQRLSQGWHIFYDTDGKYLRVPGRDVALILISKRP